MLWNPGDNRLGRLVPVTFNVRDSFIREEASSYLLGTDRFPFK